jgi:hypothetical protein
VNVEDLVSSVVDAVLEEADYDGCNCNPGVEVWVAGEGLAVNVRLIHERGCPLLTGPER